MKFSELCSHKKEIRLGYIGGSITEGDKYRTHVLNYLTAEYPENIFTEIKGGVGGTPSYLGVHRMDRDIIEQKPDIVFIEFSVNDYPALKGLFERSMEGMIRKALNYDPKIPIAVLGTTDEYSLLNVYPKGETPEMVQSHMNVAAYYNIPYINMGKALYEHLSSTGDDLKNYLPDGVHPNSDGGKIYADEIKKYLDGYDWSIDFKSEPMTEKSLEKASLFMAENYVSAPWKVSAESMKGKNPSYIYSDEVGASLELDFFGSVLGIYCTFDSDSGELDYKIDDCEWQKVSLWDKYCLDFDRACCCILASDLEVSAHHVTMKISEHKNEKSKGHAVRIGAFLWERIKSSL